jgi:hypothetical protein
MAKAGTITIAEVEEFSRTGQLDPTIFMWPVCTFTGFPGKEYEKRIERKTVKLKSN